MAAEPVGQSATEGTPGQPGAQEVRIELDDSATNATYANLCRVSSSPEELIIDFALNPNPVSGQSQRIPVSERVILNHYTAKRLAALLSTTVQRHEQAFGTLEMDYRKRLRTSPESE
ncbi:hypothetical protein Mal4_36470 [Maioricimonas rarisocia]|uniref:DUF3467 domain-containing protein n=1 Tax=Maioricimonas rarisocia TaxID=2528026 RepID=A0A517Z9Z3_9PLAN|nr:DUF3467 domain-containing protein [Maioricimonas rarisocia]QDU39308.1 hypothetical protein Mal4_36470 [Maioricimonas rarisocia]